MSKFREKLDAARPPEPSLFDTTSVGDLAGAMDQAPLVKAAMAEAIRRSKYKRLEIAFRLSTLLGYVVTEDLLNQMTSAKLQFQLKASQLMAFCKAVGNDVLLSEMLRPEGRRLMDPADEPALLLAEAMRRKRDAELALWDAERQIVEATKAMDRTR